MSEETAHGVYKFRLERARRVLELCALTVISGWWKQVRQRRNQRSEYAQRRAKAIQESIALYRRRVRLQNFADLTQTLIRFASRAWNPALRLQCWWRGIVASRFVIALRSLQWVAILQLREREAAVECAVRVQKTWRRLLARRYVSALADAHRAEVKRIKREFDGSHALALREREDMATRLCRVHRAVTIIQRAWRKAWRNRQAALERVRRRFDGPVQQ